MEQLSLMEGLVIAGCSTSVILFFLVGWLLCSRRRKPRFSNSLVISECLQPQVVCKSVPCQHPYYRVISEYSGQKIPESDPMVEKNEHIEISPKKIHETEWYRKLSLSSIQRKAGQEVYLSRRSSISEIEGIPVRVSKVKQPILV